MYGSVHAYLIHSCILYRSLITKPLPKTIINSYRALQITDKRYRVSIKMIAIACHESFQFFFTFHIYSHNTILIINV